MIEAINQRTAFGPKDASVRGALYWCQQQFPDGLPKVNEKDYFCFLSVVIRTQGNRKESLLETFLMLQGQTDNDFEILLVVHKAKPEGKACVEEVLSLLLPEFIKRIRVFFLDEGTRATPLNFGAINAKGCYYVALDDDDLVTDHWVETFHSGAKEAEGALIRSHALTQKWKTAQRKDGSNILRSEGSHRTYFCRPFSIFEMLKEDITPIACVAIPTFVVQKMGFRYDETLNVCEDWDFLVRAILYFGIYDTQEITFIYRLWEKSNGDSHALHPWEEWIETIERIKKKFETYPIITTYGDIQAYETIKERSVEISPAVMQPGFISRLRAFIDRHGILLAPFFMTWRLMVYAVTHLIPHPVPKELIPLNPGIFERISIAVRNYGLLLLPFVVAKKFICYFFTHLFRCKSKKSKKDIKELDEANDAEQVKA